MSLSTYADLKSSVAGWLNRTDLTAIIPDFVRLAEAEIRRDVRVSDMEQLVSGSLAAGVLTLPADFLEARRLVINGKSLEYVPPDEFQGLDTNGYTDVRYYTRIGRTLRVLNGADATYSLLYVASYAAFSADSDTNWLLQAAPDVYLWSACKHGAIYLRDADGATSCDGLYKAAVANLSVADNMAAFSGSQLLMRAQVPA